MRSSQTIMFKLQVWEKNHNMEIKAVISRGKSQHYENIGLKWTYYITDIGQIDHYRHRNWSVLSSNTHIGQILIEMLFQ